MTKLERQYRSAFLAFLTVLLLAVTIVAAPRCNSGNVGSPAGMENEYFSTIEDYRFVMANVNDRFMRGEMAKPQYDAIILTAVEMQAAMAAAREAKDAGDPVEFAAHIAVAHVKLDAIKTQGGVN